MTRSQQEFVDYLLSFYGEGGVYATKAVDPFGDRPMTRDEAEAVTQAVSRDRSFDGDSFDREKARDLVLEWRGSA